MPQKRSKKAVRPEVVIVGGGAGGFELVAKLSKKWGKKRFNITLVDENTTHIWKPLLHEVAAGTLNSYEDEVSYMAYASQKNFRFVQGTLIGLDRKNKNIKLAPIFDEHQQEIIPGREIHYDVLVLAIGSVTNDFGVPGVKEHCVFLDSRQEADHFQQYFLHHLMKFAFEKDKRMYITVVGGGATGVELTAELYHACNEISQHGYDFDPKNITFSIVEGSDRLLPGIKERISNAVTTKLQEMSVQIYTDEIVTEVTEDFFLTKSGEKIPGDIKVWTAGIKAPPVLRKLDGLETNRLNQLLVKSTLQTTKDNAIFALGDCACCILPDHDKPMPPRAQAAHQQASLLVKSIGDFFDKKTMPDYVYHDYGSLISLSNYETVGSLMGGITNYSIFIEGWFARLSYISLYRMHLVALFGFWRVGWQSFVNFISRRLRPRLKLH